MANLGDGLKNLILAGIGAAAMTAEKSQEIVDELVAKGELTVEQGKVLNKELTHNLKKTFDEKKSMHVMNILDSIDDMSDEEIAKIKQKLSKFEEESRESDEQKA